MNTYKNVKKQIKTYVTNFRRNDASDLEVGDLYDLFPDRKAKISGKVTAKWPDYYPYQDRRGVYIIFDDRLNLLYVGKASMGNCLGNRLAKYFGYADDRQTCRIWHEHWTKQPRYIMTVAVPIDMPFEAPALEEYLVTSLQPCDNTQGINGRN